MGLFCFLFPLLGPLCLEHCMLFHCLLTWNPFWLAQSSTAFLKVSESLHHFTSEGGNCMQQSCSIEESQDVCSAMWMSVLSWDSMPAEFETPAQGRFRWFMLRAVLFMSTSPVWLRWIVSKLVQKSCVPGNPLSFWNVPDTDDLSLLSLVRAAFQFLWHCQWFLVLHPVWFLRFEKSHQLLMHQCCRRCDCHWWWVASFLNSQIAWKFHVSNPKVGGGENHNASFMNAHVHITLNCLMFVHMCCCVFYCQIS